MKFVYIYVCICVCKYTVGLDQPRSMQQMTSAWFVVVDIVERERERKREKQRDYQR